MIALGLIAAFCLPFVLVQLLRAVRRMDRPEDQSAGPLPWCALMGLLLACCMLALILY